MRSGMCFGPVIVILAEVGTILKLLSEHRLGAKSGRLLQSKLDFVLKFVHRLKAETVMMLQSKLESVQQFEHRLKARSAMQQQSEIESARPPSC